jgi:hypothetical protein
MITRFYFGFGTASGCSWTKKRSFEGDISNRIGCNSNPQLHNSTLVPKPICISLKGTSTNPKRIDIYGVDKIFEQALIRPQTSTEMPEEDKKKTQEFVDHLFVKEIGKLRVVKYINHLIALSRISNKVNGKPLINSDKKDMERIVSEINACPK